MKKTVRITIEKEFEIDIVDTLLTEEAMKEFSSYMWEVTEPSELFEYVARSCFDEQSTHIEGLGKVVPKYMKQFNEKAVITFNNTYEDIETEIVND